MPVNVSCHEKCFHSLLPLERRLQSFIQLITDCYYNKFTAGSSNRVQGFQFPSEASSEFMVTEKNTKARPHQSILIQKMYQPQHIEKWAVRSPFVFKYYTFL